MKKVFVTLFALSFALSIFAQSKILLEIDDEKITADEFLHIYKKNNTNADAMTYSAMEEYMDLFINFKLKVHEAEKLGLDTTASFMQELSGYRTQLAQPYLTDKKVEDELIAEAYERMKYDIEVSHILIKVDPTATPADTLKAYNKIYELYNKLEKGGDFVKLARENSQDESVAFNDGNLGYRTVFGLVYEFETEMYNTPIGKYSKPFKTKFGYHILKVTNKRPAKGKYKVAHIMIVVPKDAGSSLDKEAKGKIDEIQQRIQAGEDFTKLAETYSEDRRTATDGGVLGWITVGGKMIKEFEDAVFKLEKAGDVSPVLKTNYGYHIIKLLEIEPIKSFDESKTEIKSKISNTARASRSRESVIQGLMAEYNVKTYKANLKDFYKIVTDSIFVGTWKVDEKTDLTKTILSFKDRVYTYSDFVQYLMKFNRQQNPQNIQTFVDLSYDMFVSKMVIMYEEEILEEKYPTFMYLIKEYHDGILLFELTDKTVWSKAITDTVGLDKFYQENKNNYMWKYRYDVQSYTCKDAKVSKSLVKYFNKGMTEYNAIDKLNKKDSTAVVVNNKYLLEKGVNQYVDLIVNQNNIPEQDGLKKIITDAKDNSVVIVTVYGPSVKHLNEAKGIITADYQNFLEKNWLLELRNKYKIVVNKDVLKSISY
jgi:peptidyl-prolyl cis-trans isomerase SurA